MDFVLFITIFIAGICTGGMYALFAVPFNFQVGALKVTNFAYGNFMMLFMYAVFTCISNNIPVIFMFAILLPCAFMLGYLLRRYIIFSNNENAQILLTMGLAIFVENMAIAIWGSFPRSLGAIEKGLLLGDIYISLTRLQLLVVALVVLGIAYLFLQKSWYGRCIRAMVQQEDMAKMMGINTKKVTLVAFGFSFCYLMFASYSLMLFYSVEPFTGHSFLTTCFLIAVLGGIGNLKGSFIASFIIGLISAFVSFYSPGYHDPILFSLFILMLLVRPSGLFGEA